MSGTLTHRTWQSIRLRCLNPRSTTYSKYGARGITICERWHSFEHFLADMGERPSSRHTIDRIDNALGYEPGNCRWATMKEQQNNRTNNHRIRHAGEELTLAQWSERLGIDRHTIHNRLKAGWPVHRVLSPIRHGRSGKPLSR